MKRKNMKRQAVTAFLALCGSALLANEMPSNNANPAYFPSMVQAQLRLNIREGAEMVHFIRDTNDPKIITKTYLLKHADAYAIRPYLREMVQALRVNYKDGDDPNQPHNYYNIYRTKSGIAVPAGVECIKFADGVGGGVCQVSTTLYNAVILSGLKVTEYHAHSLPVSYVAPSFDAMVSSGSADFRFVNNTHNPIIIKTEANGATLKIALYGEPMKEKYVRKSVITERIEPPAEEVVSDDKGEFPELFLGERKVLSYSKAGYKSEGYLIKIVGGRAVSSEKLRTDTYASARGHIVEGRAERPYDEIEMLVTDADITAEENASQSSDNNARITF